MVGDYALQSDYIATQKAKSNYVLTVHAAIWTFVVTMTWIILGNSIDLYQIILVLFLPHFWMDYQKSRDGSYQKVFKTEKQQLTFDQLFHYFQLAMLMLSR